MSLKRIQWLTGSSLAGILLLMSLWLDMTHAPQVARAVDAMAPAQQQAGDWPRLHLAPLVGEYSSPVQVTHAGDGSGRLFVVERPGTIRIVQNGTVLDTPFLDIQEQVDTQGECGLLSMAFAPNFAENGFLFVYYNQKRDPTNPIYGECATIIARFQVTDDPNVVDPASETQLMVVEQPYHNHNGGQVAFGPDGYLYIGLGDGGDAGDPMDRGQSLGTPLGKILRIDPLGTTGGQPECNAVDNNAVDNNAVGNNGAADSYRIPVDNPLVDGTGGACDEIWASGLRNPWRFSFDRGTGDLYIADVGQNRYEEINVQPAASSGGENYGWNVMEGLHCFEPSENCDTTGLTLPVYEYDHEEGLSISGGVVYRGTVHPRMQGIYFYADFFSGKLWGLQNVSGEWVSSLLLETGESWAGFGEDEAGNVYVADLSGSVYQLIDLDGSLFLPLAPKNALIVGGVNNPTDPVPTETVTPGLEWDERLDARGAIFIPATVTPGQGYWKLIQALWFDVEESGGRHHIFVDVRDDSGERQTGLPVLIEWPGGTTTITTQEKPGEAYAADFGMFSIAPAYSARPDDGAPADKVDGMGMGSIDEPHLAHHTSYGLTWQWTLAATETPTVTPTVTPTATATVTPTAALPTATPTATFTTVPATATPSATATTETATATATITATGSPTSAMTATSIASQTPPVATPTATATVTVTPTVQLLRERIQAGR